MSNMFCRFVFRPAQQAFWTACCFAEVAGTAFVSEVLPAHVQGPSTWIVPSANHKQVSYEVINMPTGHNARYITCLNNKAERQVSRINKHVEHGCPCNSDSCGSRYDHSCCGLVSSVTY